jgi:hypothetical protein
VHVRRPMLAWGQQDADAKAGVPQNGRHV